MQRNMVIIYKTNHIILKLWKFLFKNLIIDLYGGPQLLSQHWGMVRLSSLGLISSWVCGQTGFYETWSHKTEPRHSQNKTKHHNKINSKILECFFWYKKDLSEAEDEEVNSMHFWKPALLTLSQIHVLSRLQPGWQQFTCSLHTCFKGMRVFLPFCCYYSRQCLLCCQGWSETWKCVCSFSHSK